MQKDLVTEQLSHTSDAERRFGGLERLYGPRSGIALQQAHVAVVGIGGVGSWAAEALARSGIGALTLIDLDHVAESNINRQVHALTETLGQSKIAAMGQRIQSIHPDCRLTLVDDFLTPDNVQQLLPVGLSVVLDCTDQVAAKVAMVLQSRARQQALIVCGGAGGKTNSLALQAGDLSQATHDALLTRMRNILRREHRFARASNAAGKALKRVPKMGVRVLWVDQPTRLPEAWQQPSEGQALQGLSCAGYGSTVTVTAAMGFAAAAEAVNTILQARVAAVLRQDITITKYSASSESFARITTTTTNHDNNMTQSKALAKILSMADFEREAEKRLPRPIFGYVSGACEDCQSLQSNRDVFAEYEFISHTLIDVSSRSQQVEIFGKTYDAPFGMAPMGITAMSAYRGDIVLAEAAKQANIPMIMSGSSLIKMEELVERAPDAWFQAYLHGKTEDIKPLIDRVDAAGFKTLVVTVDTPASSNRENNVRTGFSTPLQPNLRLAWQGVTHPRWLFGTLLKTLWHHGMPHFENSFATRGAPIISANVARDFSARGQLSWDHVRDIRKRWKGPLVIKGILHPADAALARQYGMDGVIVSNHGGRQLDGAVAPLRVLPQIVEQFKDGPVMLDSGVRRGTDMMKAIALGARSVFLGRPFNYAAAVGGPEGVAHGISLLQQEVMRNMAMMGINRLSELTPESLLYVGRSAR